MPRRAHLLLAAAITTLGLQSLGRAQQQPSYDDLKAQLKQLQDRVDQLEHTQQANNQKEVDAVVEQVLKDSDHRSQVLDATGFQVGYDKGLYFRTADGNFSLTPKIEMQFRNTTNYDTGPDDLQNGFEVRLLRFDFTGNAFSKDFTYRVLTDTSRSTGAISLLEAWGQYRFAPDWAVQIGQYKEQFSQERDIGAFQQLATERTLVDAVIGGALTDRVQGVNLIYGGTKANPWRVNVDYNDGANSKNTNFQDANFDFGMGARAEYKFFGGWDDYKDFTAKGAKDDLLVLGGGLEYSDGDGGHQTLAVVDAEYKNTEGLGLFGALHGDFTNGDTGISGGGSEFDKGVILQASYLATPAIEPFGRYDVVLLDNAPGDDAFNEFTVGVNYYFGPDGSYVHRAKFTLDASYLPDGSPNAQTGVGANASENPQFIVRAQFQLIL